MIEEFNLKAYISLNYNVVIVAYFSFNCRRNVNHLWQVIQYARGIFYKIETESPLNSEAAEL